MIPGVDPKVDYAFKKIFGSEANVPVLVDLLEAVLKPSADERIAGLEIRNPFNDKDALDDKLSILDIKARDRKGRQYNIEMQMVGSRLYPPRVLYYWAVLHSQQLHAGDDYATLQPTISISFVNGVLFPQVPDHHLHFQLHAPDTRTWSSAPSNRCTCWSCPSSNGRQRNWPIRWMHGVIFWSTARSWTRTTCPRRCVPPRCSGRWRC